MNHRPSTWLSMLVPAFAGLVLAFAGLACASTTKQSAAIDRGGVEEAVAEFYAALNAMFTGDLAPMDALWSHADDVTYMGPDQGYQVGWSQVRANWQKQAAMKLGGEVHPVDVHINAGRDIAVAHNWEKGENPGSGGGPRKVSIRATNVFRKESGRWKMIGHHTDTIPFLME